MGGNSTKQSSTRTIPSSLRHKRILDLAAKRPDASFEAIAEEVPSATADLVETVLNEYGDPADEANEPPTEDASSNSEAIRGIDDGTVTSERETVSISDLTARQKEILHTVWEHPQASQREIGEQLGITGATVCNHVSTIKENAWENRRQLIADMFDHSSSSTTAKAIPTATDGGEATAEESKTIVATDDDSTAQIEQLRDRIATLEEKIAANETHADKLATDTNPELTRKILHACLNAETISEEEELELIGTFV